MKGGNPARAATGGIFTFSNIFYVIIMTKGV
jgi:hypothetical protein